MVKLLILAYSDKSYSFFNIPFIYFALRNNPDSEVEIITEDLAYFLKNNQESFDFLNQLYPNKFIVREPSTKLKAIPGTIRFIEEPILKADYLYIGDIDLFILEDVRKKHLKLIQENNIPFSNIIRKESLKTEYPRLTGLHFCRFKDYYPLPNVSDLDLLKLNDEHVLYLIMKRKGIMVSDTFQNRPICGVHASLNRDPTGRTSGSFYHIFEFGPKLSWISHDYKDIWLNQIKENSFLKLQSLYNIDLKSIFLTIEAAFKGEQRKLHRRAMAHSIDKRLIVEEKYYSKLELKKERETFIDSKNFKKVIQQDLKSLVLWPFNLELWHQLAWGNLAIKEYEICAEALLHLIEIPKGDSFLKTSGMSKKLKHISKNLSGQLKVEFDDKLSLVNIFE